MNTVTKVNDELPFKEPKFIVLTLDEAKAIHKYLWDTVGTIHVDKAQGKMIGSFIKKVWWKLNADDEEYDS